MMFMGAALRGAELETEMKKQFKFKGIVGYLHDGITVCWGGMTFQIECAPEDMRAAIGF